MCSTLSFSVVNANQDCQLKQTEKPLISSAEIKHLIEIEMKKLSKVENNQIEQQTKELAFWRSRIDEMGSMSFFLKVVSVLIPVLISVYLWSYMKLLPAMNNAKLIVESWKDLSLLLSDIQLSILQEHSKMNATGSLEINNDPILSNIMSLNITRALQRLTSEDYKVVKNSYDYLNQTRSLLQQKSKSKIKLYIGEILSSGIVVQQKNKKLLITLLSEFV